MNICHIHYSHFPFQTTPIPYEYTKNLSGFGVRSQVIALTDNSTIENEDLVEGVSVRRVPTHGNSRKLSTLEHFSRNVNEILSRGKFDIVHVYAFRGAGYVRIRSHSLGNKWLYHLITGNISGGIRSTLGDTLTRIESHFFDKVIVNTQNVGKHVLGDTSSVEIPPGVDFSRFLPVSNNVLRKRLGYELNDIVTIYSGSLKPTRKLNILFEGFAEALSRCEKLQLLIIGSSDSTGVRSILGELKIQNNVNIIGPVPYLEMQNYLAVADIGLAFVPITPEYNSQPALKTLEMLSSGKPVIATATDGNRYFIQDGVNGMLVMDNYKDIADAILELVDNQDLRKRLGRASRVSVEKYDWSQIVENKLIPLYRDLVNISS